MAAQEVPSNGVPLSRLFEDTAEHVSAEIAAAKEGEGDSNEALASIILTALRGNGDSGGGDDGGDDGGVGAKALKDVKKHKWIAGLVMLLVGPGSMTATYYAIKDRGIANAASVQQLEKDATETHPVIEANTKSIVVLKRDVKGINESVSDIQKGIKSLQKVNVTRLEKENEKLERKVRILEANR